MSSMSTVWCLPGLSGRSLRRSNEVIDMKKVFEHWWNAHRLKALLSTALSFWAGTLFSVYDSCDWYKTFHFSWSHLEVWRKGWSYEIACAPHAIAFGLWNGHPRSLDHLFVYQRQCMFYALLNQIDDCDTKIKNIKHHETQLNCSYRTLKSTLSQRQNNCLCWNTRPRLKWKCCMHIKLHGFALYCHSKIWTWGLYFWNCIQ